MSHITELIGKVLDRVEIREEEILFFAGDEQWRMYHSQDCCENVSVEEVIGDVADLCGSPIVEASERQEHTDKDESSTWTFYLFRTVKGDVTIRWYGNSNGYYSEDVDFARVTPLPEGT